MTTINTIEDLVRLLDEHPQWMDAVRARVLTRELIELPQTLAKFAAGTNEHFAEVDQQLAKIDRRFDEVDQRFDKVEQRLDRVEGGISALRDDIAPLKGAHVRNAAVREACLIAEDMGFTLVRTLGTDQIRALAQDVTDIPANELRSFYRADLIMEVTDREGEICYLAVEISFTVNGRDTARAIRNAGFLAKLSGKRSSAAVAGVRHDDRIDRVIESGEVFWYQLAPSDLEAE